MGRPDLDAGELERYARQIVLEEVGPAGQTALLDARVLVVGAGGLGSPVIQYLAAAGIGTLGIADDDVVERSNLGRQVIHGTDDLGRSKVDSARDFVAALNPGVDVEPHRLRVTPDTVEELLASYDFVVDASDNFPTRYLVNDACSLAGVPYSHGAVLRFEGQVTTFLGRDDSPCYRCIFPEAPPPGSAPDCATAGILGVLPGTIGCLQATETVKHLLGRGTPLDGRLVVFDALGMRFDVIRVSRDPACPVCGESPTVTSVHDVAYDGACSAPAE